MPDQITKQIVISISIIVLVFLFLGSIILAFVLNYRRRHQQNLQEKFMMQQAFSQQLLQSQIETQEETFSALGKELHDNIGQLLNSTKLLIGVSQRTLVNYPDTLGIADETLGKAINELRALSKSLNKEWLQQFNFMENLEAEVRRINAADNLQVHFTAQPTTPFKSDEQIILFRIVQEALQNAIKHAQANSIYIRLATGIDWFTIVVEDNGKGFVQTPQHAAGVGMLNMQQRIKLLGGNIAWQSTAAGTTVSIYLPIKPVDA